MRTVRILRLRMLAAAAAAALLATPALAQMYPGEDVTVNPAGLPTPAWETPGRIVLHRPVHRRVHHHAAAKAADQTATATPPSTETAAPPAETPPPAPEKKTAKAKPGHEAPAQSADTANNPLPFTFGGTDATLGAQPAPAKTDTQNAGLAKRGEIRFEHNATDPQPYQLDGIKTLAGDLNSAIEAGATKIQLQAYAGAPGDKSSDARRLALRRALAVRQLLIDDGVPSSRIDVRAMGGITDNGQPDRVDVFVRAS